MQLYVWFDHVTSCVTLGKLLISLLQFLYLKFQMGIIIVPTWYHSIPGMGPGALQILYAGYFFVTILWVYDMCEQYHSSAETQKQKDEPFRINWNSTLFDGPARMQTGCCYTWDETQSQKITFCGSVLYLQLTCKHPKEDATIWRQLSSFPLWEKIVSLGSPLPYP